MSPVVGRLWLVASWCVVSLGVWCLLACGVCWRVVSLGVWCLMLSGGCSLVVGALVAGLWSLAYGGSLEGWECLCSFSFSFL